MRLNDITENKMAYLIGFLGSLLLLWLPYQTMVSVQMSALEAVAVVTSAWSVWLLARNQLLGWWVGLVGVTAYGFLFYQVSLYAEVGLQAFYFLTSIQAVYIWLRGGTARRERAIERIPLWWAAVTLVLGVAALFGLQHFLESIRGAAPFWDALTTIVSLIAHLYLMGRFLESWYLWIAVDIIYVPLYASRGLYLTSILYVIFLVMSIQGLRNFWKIYREQSETGSDLALPAQQVELS